RMSFTSELLPDPETPVTQTNAPSGISTSMPCRLLCRAPRILRVLPEFSGGWPGLDRREAPVGGPPGLRLAPPAPATPETLTLVSLGRPVTIRRFAGTSIFNLPERYCPVTLFFDLAIFSAD